MLSVNTARSRARQQNLADHIVSKTVGHRPAGAAASATASRTARRTVASRLASAVGGDGTTGTSGVGRAVASRLVGAVGGDGTTGTSTVGRARNNNRKTNVVFEVDPKLLVLPNAPKHLRQKFEQAMHTQVAAKAVHRRPWEVAANEVEDFCKILEGPRQRIDLDSIYQFFLLPQLRWHPTTSLCFMNCLREHLLNDPKEEKFLLAQREKLHRKSRPFKTLGEYPEDGEVEYEPTTCNWHHVHYALKDHKVQHEMHLQNQQYREQYYRAQKAKDDLTKREKEVRTTHVTRDQMVRHLELHATRNDAFLSLPSSVTFIFIFLWFVSEHIHIFSRGQIEQSIEGWLDGTDPFTQASATIRDVPSLWTWMLDVGIPQVFQAPEVDSQGTVRYRLASRHFAVTDVELHFQFFEETGKPPERFWLLQTGAARRKLQASPNDHLTAALHAAEHIRDTMGQELWVNKISFSLLAFDDATTGVSLSTITIFFDRYGHVLLEPHSDSFYMNLYTAWHQYIIDGLYTILGLHIFVREVADLSTLSAAGWDGFMHYWDIWNVVDWWNISLTILIGLSWGVLFAAVGSSNFNEIVTVTEHGFVMKDVTRLTEHHLYELKEDFLHIYGIITWLRMFTSSAFFALVLQNFKGFQSNARLKVITDTLIKAQQDLLHVFLVFVSIFIPFGLLSHIVFGLDFEEFSSPWKSIIACTMAMLREFEWYFEAYGPMHLSLTHPSGLPFFFRFLWFVVFQTLLVVIVLNMLVGVIFEHYTSIAGDLALDMSAVPVWEQVHDYATFWHETVGFLRFDQLLSHLESPETHPVREVTEESLLDAFPGMAERQAEWLLKFLKKEVYNTKVAEQAYEEENLDEWRLLKDIEENNCGVDEFEDMLDDPWKDDEVYEAINLATTIIALARKEMKALSRELTKLMKMFDFELVPARVVLTPMSSGRRDSTETFSKLMIQSTKISAGTWGFSGDSGKRPGAKLKAKKQPKKPVSASPSAKR